VVYLLSSDWLLSGERQHYEILFPPAYMCSRCGKQWAARGDCTEAVGELEDASVGSPTPALTVFDNVLI